MVRYGLHNIRMSLHQRGRNKRNKWQKKGEENMRMGEFVAMRDEVHVAVVKGRRPLTRV